MNVSAVLLGPPPLGRLRLASVEDATGVYALLTESMRLNFRIESVRDIVKLIEEAVLTIIQMDQEGEIVGCLAARDYPLIPSLDPRGWQEYIWTKYKTVEMSARNTLFIHLLCWDYKKYLREVIDNMLRSMFMHDPFLMHVAMLKNLRHHQLLVPGQSRCESMFRRVTVTERGVPADLLPAMVVADRNEACPRLRIRRAVEEDNDDLVPIIERHSKRLRELYGEFYISELISRHPESERVLLVCEHKELAVGVMILNTQINCQALEESFELSPFSGLRNLTDRPVSVHDNVGDSSTCNLLESASCSLINLENIRSTSVIEPMSTKKPKNVAWINDDCESILSQESSTPFADADVMEFLDVEDDDDLEYDIVNIDTDLLRVPKLLSYDVYVNGMASDISKMMDNKPQDQKVEKVIPKAKRSASASSLGPTYQAPEPTRYSGPVNAFLLEVFAMHPDYDDRYGFDMLQVAYELFPNKDYCVLCVPSNQAAFPLLEQFTLVTPLSCRKLYINESLYVAHINTIRGNVSVRTAVPYDTHAVDILLENVPRKKVLQELFHKSLRSKTLDSFILLSQEQPVGMIVIGPLDDATVIRTQYALQPQPRTPGADGAILAGVISPVLEPHSRWYIRDVLRQSIYTTLFWICRLMAKGDANPSRNLMSFAGRLVPVLPRRAVPNISGDRDLSKILTDTTTPFALWWLETPLTMLPKVDVNNGIVVVGASRTGLAFIEHLIMGPASRYLTFTNITLISEHGLPTVTECLRAADNCVPKDGRYTDRYIKSIPFYFYVDVISAVLTKIDRKHKCVYLKGGGVKYYDELVLTCGMQFQHPEYLAESLEIVKELQKGKPCVRTLMDDPSYEPDRVPNWPDLPDNVMLINSLFEANICLRKLLRMISDLNGDEIYRLSDENRVVVYGDCLEAYSCMSALLELGLTAKQIAFVEPFPSKEPGSLRVNCFNNETVDERVQASVESLGITVYRRCLFSSWKLKGNRMVNINLSSRVHIIQLPCFALFYYGTKAINLNAFKAINESGLVYDGGVVVGPVFETNDPHVYGAGPCTVYSRKLYASDKEQKYFCSEDVGEALATLFLRKFNPFEMGDPSLASYPSEVLPRYKSSLLSCFDHKSIPILDRLPIGRYKRWQPVKQYESPITQSATFPGPLYYLKVRKPGREIPMEVQLSLPHQGHTLVTTKDGNYFRLQLNVLHCVSAITCLSRKKFYPALANLYAKHEAYFNKLLARFMALANLYGQHEAYFNKLPARFMIPLKQEALLAKTGQRNRIEDLFEFFTQPWMSALYLETFDELVSDINYQDVGKVREVLMTHFTVNYKDEPENPECNKDLEDPECRCFTKEESKASIESWHDIGTFRAVIDKHIAEHSNTELRINAAHKDIPSECGQAEATRREARGFWDAVGGEQVVNALLARYLDRNFVCNPHYAKPKPELS